MARNPSFQSRNAGFCDFSLRPIISHHFLRDSFVTVRTGGVSAPSQSRWKTLQKRAKKYIVASFAHKSFCATQNGTTYNDPKTSNFVRHWKIFGCETKAAIYFCAFSGDSPTLSVMAHYHQLFWKWQTCPARHGERFLDIDCSHKILNFCFETRVFGHSLWISDISMSH